MKTFINMLIESETCRLYSKKKNPKTSWTQNWLVRGAQVTDLSTHKLKRLNIYRKVFLKLNFLLWPQLGYVV